MGSGEEGSLYMFLGFIRNHDEIWQYNQGFSFTHVAFQLRATKLYAFQFIHAPPPPAKK